jgi:signal transduction histidine kinase
MMELDVDSRNEDDREFAALRREIALRDQFIGMVAHELRNPLSPAYMQLEHIKEVVRQSDESISPSWLHDQLEAMTMRFDRFLETLNRLLDASRLADGHLLLLPERCDLVAITRQAMAGAERELRASRCASELDAAESELFGWWDPLRLEQIIGNLLSNAARYGAGRPISVRIAASAETAQLQVRDHGIGIAADDVSRIFKRFERARNAGRSSGLGIGLWIVAELCHAMGGTVEVDSVLGEGATFTVTLPRLPRLPGTR